MKKYCNKMYSNWKHLKSRQKNIRNWALMKFDQTHICFSWSQREIMCIFVFKAWRSIRAETSSRTLKKLKLVKSDVPLRFWTTILWSDRHVIFVQIASFNKNTFSSLSFSLLNETSSNKVGNFQTYWKYLCELGFS